jgi:hypothetical protein
MSTFSDVIGKLNNGVTHATLTERLKELSHAVLFTRKTGEITLKLKVSPNGELGVTITDDVKVKMPELTRGASVFFVDNEGSLLQRNPNQAELFREVVKLPVVSGEVHDPETGEITKVS